MMSKIVITRLEFCMSVHGGSEQQKQLRYRKSYYQYTHLAIVGAKYPTHQAMFSQLNNMSNLAFAIWPLSNYVMLT